MVEVVVVVVVLTNVLRCPTIMPGGQGVFPMVQKPEDSHTSCKKHFVSIYHDCGTPEHVGHYHHHLHRHHHPTRAP